MPFVQLLSLPTADAPAALAELSVLSDAVVAYGWKDRVRVPLRGVDAVCAMAPYRYETRRWFGPRTGYRARRSEGVVLLNEFGRPLLVIPGRWDDGELATFAARAGVPLREEPVPAHRLVAARHLRLAPERRMIWYDVAALMAAEVLGREAVEWGVLGGIGHVGPLFWLALIGVAGWFVARGYWLAERAEYRLWLERNLRRRGG